MGLTDIKDAIDIVLAEDDPEDVEIFKMALETVGSQVRIRHVPNGDRLMDLLEQSIPDILFLDMHMPCKDGLACISEIRQQPKYDTMPIVMYTTQQYRKLIEEKNKQTANYYIDKPDSINELVEQLQQLLVVLKLIVQPK